MSHTLRLSVVGAALLVAACCLGMPQAAAAGPITLTSLVGDKDHPPYPDNLNYNEGSPAQVDVGDPTGFDWGYHAGGSPTFVPSALVDATVNWTHVLDLTGVVIDSVQLNVVVIGFRLGVEHQRLFVGNPLTEIADAFLPWNDGVKTLSFSLDPSVLTGGTLPVQLWVKGDEGWGGVDYSELIVNGHTSDDPTHGIPEPGSMLLIGVGVAAMAARRRQQALSQH